MILFFFLLLMLAIAWGVADHSQSILRNSPPAPAPAAVVRPAARPVTANEPPIAAKPGDTLPGMENTSADMEPGQRSEPVDAAALPSQGEAREDKDEASK